jgi:hypothetical protein
MIQLEQYQLNSLCLKFAELGAASFAKKLVSGEVRFDPQADRLSQREAYRMFGARRVDRWTRDGAVSGARGGEGKNSKIIYSHAALLEQEAREAREMREVLSVTPIKQRGETEQERMQARIDFYTHLLELDIEEAYRISITEVSHREATATSAAQYRITAVIDEVTYTAVTSGYGMSLAEIAKHYRQDREKEEDARTYDFLSMKKQPNHQLNN